MLQEAIFVKSNAFNSSAPTHIIEATRISINKNEAYRLSSEAHRVRILSGTAWITRNQEDMVVLQGEVVELPGDSRHSSFIASLYNAGVTFEIVGAK